MTKVQIKQFIGNYCKKGLTAIERPPLPNLIIGISDKVNKLFSLLDTSPCYLNH